MLVCAAEATVSSGEKLKAQGSGIRAQGSKGKGERIGIVFHSLRHTRTTKWVEMGFSDEITRRATGHKSLSAYQQYVKLDPAAVIRLVDNPKPDMVSREPIEG